VNELILKGIDGANPLGFLAAVGTVTIAKQFSNEISMSWRREFGSWRPILVGDLNNETSFSDNLAKALSEASEDAFEAEKKLPFSAKEFAKLLKEASEKATPDNRRTVDFFSAFGSEVCIDKENFQDTLFRMVRSGDAAGQGFLFYARSIRDSTNAVEIYHTLFEPWEYKDKGYSLRWDPNEDQRYALRWDDPSKNKDPTINSANALAIEALPLFPTLPTAGRLATTAFFSYRGRDFFTWPIWNETISVEVIRSLLSLKDLHVEIPPRKQLLARGIVEIYRCERIAPNKYYKNFAPAVPA